MDDSGDLVRRDPGGGSQNVTSPPDLATLTGSAVPVDLAGGDLRMEDGARLLDTSGDSRLELETDRTRVNDPGGRVRLDVGTSTILSFYGDDSPQFMFDQEGGFNAVRFRTASSSPSTLELSNTELDMAGQSITDSAQGFLDLSGASNDVRIATGQAIQDESGTNRVSAEANSTSLRGQNGDLALVLTEGSRFGFNPTSSETVDIFDASGGFTALQYTTSSSAPGTLELGNAELDLTSNQLLFDDEGGGTQPAIFTDSNGEIIARNDDGTTTQLT
jgi:hypothetical protein